MEFESSENTTEKIDSEENITEKNEKMDSDESVSEAEEEEEYSYIKTRRGIANKTRAKPDKLKGEYSYQNQIQQRSMGQPCIDCKIECDKRLAERFRLDNYLKFWGKINSWDDRRTFLRRLVQVLRDPHPKNEIRKKYLRKYYLELEDGLVLVCKTMFFNTLAISEKFIETTILKYPENILDESTAKIVNNPSSIPKMFENKGVRNKKSHTESTLVDTVPLPLEAKLLNQDCKLELKPPCSCPDNCGSKIPEDTRIKIHDHFWSLNTWEERKLFVVTTVEKDRYTSLLTLVLPMKNGDHITTCQEMYLNTLGLTKEIIDVLMHKTESPLKRKLKEEPPKCNPEDLKTNGRNPVNTPNGLKFEQQHYSTPQFGHILNGLQEHYNTPQFGQIAIPNGPGQEQYHTPQFDQIILPNGLHFEQVAFQHADQLNPLQNPVKANVEPPNALSSELVNNTHVQETPQKKKKTLEFMPLKPPCSCHLQCRVKLTENVRGQIHKEFWNLPLIDQKCFILSTIQSQRTKENTPIIKCFMLPFQCDNVPVCKEMYLNTLTVPEDFVTKTVRSINLDGSIIEDEEQNCSQEVVNSPARTPKANASSSTEQKQRENGARPEGVKRVRRSKNDRKMGPSCPESCRLRCSSKFDEETRKALHEKFWSTDWPGQKQFVMNTVKEFPIKNRSIPGRLTKRNFSRIYTLPKNEKNITVCQKMYFNTLSVCSKFVSTVHIWASQVKW